MQKLEPDEATLMSLLADALADGQQAFDELLSELADQPDGLDAESRARLDSALQALEEVVKQQGDRSTHYDLGSIAKQLEGQADPIARDVAQIVQWTDTRRSLSKG